MLNYLKTVFHTLITILLINVLFDSFKEELFVFAIKAIYEGTNFIPMQPIPVKGKVWMSDDFDEPLDEMKEYM